MGDEENVQLEVITDSYTTPLRSVVMEVHEIFQELQAVGFPDAMSAQIVAHMLTETILYSEEYVMEDDSDEDEDGDDDLDGTDA